MLPSQLKLTIQLFVLFQSVLAPNCTGLARKEDKESEGALEGEEGWPPFSELTTSPPP
jgi:hypothetical protein